MSVSEGMDGKASEEVIGLSCGVAMMKGRKKNDFNEDMSESFISKMYSSSEEVVNSIKDYKYKNDEIFSFADSMSQINPEFPFLLSLGDWPEIQKGEKLSFSMLCPEALEILFHQEQNPLYIWRAYKNCREHGITIPDWVLDYLDSSAVKLLNVGYPENPATDAYNALDLKRDGSGTLFSKYCDSEKKLNAVCRVIALRNDKEGSERPKAMDIYNKVANEYNYEFDTIQRLFKEHRHLFTPPT